jgi:hypothetical protein
MMEGMNKMAGRAVSTPVNVVTDGDGRSSLALLLRLDSVRNDGVGWTATFHGKPDTHGNSITVPVSAEQAAWLEPGEQYYFVLAEKAE